MFGNQIGGSEFLTLLLMFGSWALGIGAVCAAAYYLFSRTPMGKAIMDGRGGGDDTIAPAIAEEFAAMRAELEAMHERLDFAERIIAQANTTESIAKTAEQRHRTPPEPMALR